MLKGILLIVVAIALTAISFILLEWKAFLGVFLFIWANNLADGVNNKK